MATQNSLNNSSDIFAVTSGITNTTGTVTLNSGTSAFSLSTDSSTTTVNLGSGAAAKTVTLGSIDTSSSLALKFGTGNCTLASATGTVMNMRNTGEITYPLQSAFLAYLASDDNNVTGAGATYTLGTPTALTEIFDQNNDFATGTFTAPVTGRYRFKSHFRLGALSALMTAIVYTLNTSNRLYKSGYISGAVAKNNANNLHRAADAFTDMDAGDTATLNIVVSNGAGDTASADADTPTVRIYFCGSLIC